MQELWIENLLKLRGLREASTLQALHWAARVVLRKEGYRWELRRNGELKIGYWRKILKSKDHRSSYPKRFVLMPGFGDTPLSWYFVISLLRPILKQNFDEVILFDFPGFGGFLSRERVFPSMDLMRTHVNDTLDYLKPHTILGHSLGGWLTGHYAAQCGEGVRPTSNKLNYSGPDTIILANASGVYPDEATKQAMASIFIQSRSDGFSALRPHLFAKEPAWFKYMTAHFQNFVQREDVGLFMDSVRDDHVLEKSAKQIKSKVWLLWGEKDTLVPASCSTAWLRHLSAEFKSEHHAVLLRHSGHSPQIEQPAVTAVIIAQILSRKIPHRMGRRWWTVVQNEAIQVT